MSEMKEEIRKRFDAYKNEMFADLGKLVAINSERGETKPGCPFGEGPKQALETALKMGADMGFKIDNVDNYAGSIEYGDGAEAVGILGHLDIVPAGEGWSSDPFTLTERDGRMFGRGTIDDKGAVVAALYGMRILRDMGLPMTRTLRLIVGTNEEQGSACMKYYAEHRSAPSIGFTPDADYPLIFAEKGNFWNWLCFPLEKTAVIEMKGGNAFNAVPSECTVKLDKNMVDAAKLKASINMEDTVNYPAEVTTLEDGNILLSVKGRAAHGSTPQLGVNAVVSAANILCRYLGESAGKLLHFVSEVLGRDAYGETCGVAMQDEVSGRLSLNMGMIKYDATEQKVAIDIRYPVTNKLKDLTDKYADMAARYGLTFEVAGGSEPHYVPKDSEVVTKLLNVYREVTGDKNAEAFAIGGGTYAKTLGKNFVAFGPEFPGSEPTNMHDVDEHIVISQFMDHCVICAMAMYELAH